MATLRTMLEYWIEDVNQEDGVTLQLFARITEKMFVLIKWFGIPFVVYLLFVSSTW
ncbi:hypothetical protein [Bacillus rubiinfantis]|uniref:hypothetical protein n=1 Tax=Bacillus rubiinfantis TaxID=1499680 RepID=UPI000B148A9C|nr:hypothetical protein [Bacillus rubiinfantis]